MNSTDGKPRVLVKFNGYQRYYEWYGWLHALGGEATPWALVEDEDGKLQHIYLASRQQGEGSHEITFVDLLNKKRVA